jgi:hypothetical protein
LSEIQYIKAFPLFTPEVNRLNVHQTLWYNDISGSIMLVPTNDGSNDTRSFCQTKEKNTNWPMAAACFSVQPNGSKYWRFVPLWR